MRVKKVFNNAELCHIWAHNHEQGKAGVYCHGRNPGNSLYFEGSKIYSYGSHYLAAQKHKNKKGEYFALVNNHNYSNTTAKQLGDIRRALQGYIPYFCVSNPADIKQAVKELDQAVKNWETYELKRLKVTDRTALDYALQRQTDLLKEANKLRELLGLKPKKQDIKARARVAKHYAERLKRYHELNTPEAIEKRKAEKEKRDARKAALALEKQAEKIAAWRRGEFVGHLALPNQILRVRGDVVETSGGARVPLEAALKLYKILDGGPDAPIPLPGYEIGNYKFNGFDGETITIGCHRIRLEEAAAVLGEL